MNSKKSEKTTDEKAGKLRSMFFVYMLRMSWKLVISFLLPFFVGLFLANGNTNIIATGAISGLVFSAITIFVETKHISKDIENVV